MPHTARRKGLNPALQPGAPEPPELPRPMRISARAKNATAPKPRESPRNFRGVAASLRMSIPRSDVIMKFSR